MVGWMDGPWVTLTMAWCAGLRQTSRIRFGEAAL